MPKHPRKKQKMSTSRHDTEQQPLGSVVLLTDDASKDEEEQRLESMLFGTASFDIDDIQQRTPIAVDEFGHGESGDKELKNMLDSDVSLNPNKLYKISSQSVSFSSLMTALVRPDLVN